MINVNTEVPDGFERHFRQSPLTDPWEPLYSKRTEKAVIIGLRLARPHTNSRGLIHGGLIAALSDNAMGYSCAHIMGGASSLVTIGQYPTFLSVGQVQRVADLMYGTGMINTTLSVRNMLLR